MKAAKKSIAILMSICLVLGYLFPVPAQAAENNHTIVLNSTQNSDGSYSHSVLYDGQEAAEYDYTWHVDPSTAHDEVSNSPAEYHTGTKPGNDAVYIAHDIYYYPELPTSGFTRKNYDGEQEWCYYYTASGYTGYIFSTLPGRGSLPTEMMHSAEDAYQNAVLHITQPGNYTISGNWHGQIWVDLDNYCDDPFTNPSAKVNLIMNGVDIECTVAPGVVFYNVYECDNTWEDQTSWSHVVDTTDAGAIVTLVDGMVNNVSGCNIFRILKTQYKSGSTSVQKKRLKMDAAFYSYQSMNIQGGAKGTGVLNITSGFEGLDTELHLTINSGNVYIQSQDDGINVNEDNVSVLTINGGNLHILAGLGQEGDGIDSNGFICVNGGTTISMAKPQSDSGMDSDFGTYVFGGNVVALGSTMDWATNDSSVSYTHSTMNLQFSSSKSAGDAIVITDSNGNGIFAYDPDKDEITGANVRTYTGAIISCDAFEIGQSYKVYIGGEVNGTETMGVYDMSTVTSVSNTYQQSYGSSGTGSGSNRPGRPGSSGGSASGSGGTTTFTFTSNVNKFSSVANYSSATTISVTPQEAPEVDPEDKTYYLFGYINGANYACQDDYENMGIYQFVEGQLITTFTSDSYVAVKEQDNANWYMFRNYCADTVGTLYDTDTGAGEKMYVPGNVEITFTLAENADGTLRLSYTTSGCDHTYTASVTTEATCLYAGVRTYTCSKCGHSYTEEIPATGHDYTITVVAPSCENNGYTIHACKYCSYSYNDTPVNPLGHDYSSVVVTAPTCTERGYTTYTCSRCGNVKEWDYVNATGHNYVSGTCTTCGALDSDYVEPVVDYYLFGYINGANYACEEDWANLGEYKFVNGNLTVTFTQNSYVAVKAGDNNNWFMFSSYVTETSGTLLNTNKGTSEKMFIPGGVQVNFTLVENADGSLTLSYTTGSGSTVKVSTLTLNYPSLSFEDEILYNVYYTVDDTASIVEMGLVTFNSKLENGTIANAVDVIPGYVSDGSTYMAQTNGIPAKNLGDALYFKVYAKLTDGSYVYSDVAGYHAVAYAKTVLNDSSSSAKAKSLVVAMLNYGAAAQTYFNYNTGSLMNASLTSNQKALVSSYSSSMVADVVKASSSKVGSFVMNGGYSNIYPTVSFEGAFAINFYFTPSNSVSAAPTFYYWDAATYNSVSTLTAANATGVLTMISDGDGNWGAAVEGIAAKNMDSTIYVAGIYTSNGVSYPTNVISYSLGSYCKTVAANGEAFGSATAVYGYYAKAYFA